MNVAFLEIKGTWRDIADAARTTIGMEKGRQEPSASWKKAMLLAEHSPIRQLLIRWKWVEIHYWVSVHFVRHKIGIEHFVRTQRTDRTGVNRDDLPQSALVTHECIANVQALINISRKRLCRQASDETREAWQMVLDRLRDIEPETYQVMVPECIYRGFCPELRSCGYHETTDYQERLRLYRARKPFVSRQETCLL
jgi:hypothetical protein